MTILQRGGDSPAPCLQAMYACFQRENGIRYISLNYTAKVRLYFIWYIEELSFFRLLHADSFTFLLMTVRSPK